MASIYDYLHWRGDLSFNEVPLNVIDTMIFSRLSYLPFDTLVAPTFAASVSLLQVLQDLLPLVDKSALNGKDDYKLVQALIEAPRYQQLSISGFVNDANSTANSQFTAVTFRLTDNQSLIAFRGTDDTIVGWEEDFNMSFMDTVPAQLSAARYFKRAALALSGEFFLVGHSKGGNLATFAAAENAETLQERVSTIYSLDGPGFKRSILQKPNWQAIKTKTKTIVPQSSIVGLLLEHSDKYQVIKSSGVSFWQHNLYAWEVEVDHLVPVPELSNSSKFFDETLQDWLETISDEERKQFLDILFAAINSSKIKTVNQLPSNWKKISTNLKTALTTNPEMDPMVRHMIQQLFTIIKTNLSILTPKYNFRRSEKE